MSDFQQSGRGNKRPSYKSDLGSIEAEIRKLWARVNQPRTQERTIPQEQQWSYSATVKPEDDVDGEPWLPPSDLVLVELVLTLAADSAVTYSVRTYVNAALIRTDTITAGDVATIIPLQITVGRNVPMFPRLLAAATGDGESLGISYRWIPL